MTTTTSTTAGFVQLLECAEVPGNLFAPDLFCDFNMRGPCCGDHS